MDPEIDNYNAIMIETKGPFSIAWMEVASAGPSVLELVTEGGGPYLFSDVMRFLYANCIEFDQLTAYLGYTRELFKLVHLDAICLYE